MTPLEHRLRSKANLFGSFGGWFHLQQMLLQAADRIAELETSIEACSKRNETDADCIAELEGLLELARKDAAFYKSCALSGEIPKEGSQPSAALREGEKG